MNGRFRGRGTTWVDDVRGGLNAFLLEALIVLALMGFAVVVSFLAVTVV